MKKLLLLCCTIPLFIMLGSCPNPVEGPGETGGTSISIGFGPGGLVILREDGSNALEGENLIWKDRDPSRLVLQLKSGGWTDISWYVDGNTKPEGTGPSITLEAFRYRETAHTLTFKASYNGVPQAAAIPFTITAHRAADIVWTQTENDSSLTNFDLASWTGWGDSLETWELSVVEQPQVYFAVHKRPGQIITQGGTDGGRVRKAEPGITVDGSTADETLDIFTVDTGDTLFAGGSRNFTLAVTEAGRTENKIVTVNIRVRPRPTGIALFYVENERLTRITPGNAADYANTYYASHKAGTFPAWGMNFADVTNLATAIEWLNNYAKGGTAESWTEYLIRVEKDEALIKTAIHCYGGMPFPELAADYVKIRLRGYGGERVLTHADNAENPLLEKKSENSSSGFTRYLYMGYGFLNVGLQSGGSSNGLNHIALHLEENITIDAGGGTDQYFPGASGNNIRSMVSVDKNCSFVMEPGSRLRNYAGVILATISDFCAVLVYKGGLFEMNGGELADIRCGINLVCLWDNTSRFVYRAGTFSGNNSNFIGLYYGNTLKIYDDPDFRPQD
ncbi:MAG: hypothetical protein LBF63_03245 [Treponema sp.]|jgi:hypothetical protein|nr:hypothetical protein [Treponema sp.]